MRPERAALSARGIERSLSQALTRRSIYRRVPALVEAFVELRRRAAERCRKDRRAWREEAPTVVVL